MRKKKIDFGAYLFLIPAFVIYVSIIVFPVIYSFFISLHDWNGIKEMNFVGMQNYTKLIVEDEVFQLAFKNTVIWVFLTIVATTSIALWFAVMLNKKFKGRTFFRGLFYFPCVIAPIAVSLIWQWMYEPNIGFFNWFFQALGIDYKQTWISDPDVSLYALFFAALWQMIGQPMILFLAGLQTIPAEMEEAAVIDGANGVQKFINITIPMLKESFVMVLATLIVNAINVYDMIKGLTNGGPNNATQVLSTYMYTQTFQYNNVGYGTAIACIMLVVSLVVIVPYVMFSAKE